MKISPIGLSDLKTLGPLLSQSAGYSVSIEDEIAYYDPEIAKSWFFASDIGGRSLGLIRSFKQGPDWSLGEIFVLDELTDRQNIAFELIKRFSADAKFPTGHRLRFDIHASDSELNNAIIEFGYSESQQNFLHFELTVSIKKTGYKKTQPALEQAKEIACVLSYLNPVSEINVVSWIKSDSIRLIESDSQVVSAAQVLMSDDSIEINRIATHEKYLRCGHAKKLMSDIIQESAEIGIPKVYLKVEDIRSAAIAAYKSLGFVEVKEKSQIWHSKWY